MVKFEYMNQLLPFYEELMTERQKEIVHLYFYEDLSLSEIAENLEISRNGVYDAIKKAEKMLEEYESKLHLCANYQARKKYYSALGQLNNKEVNQIVDELMKLEEEEIYE